MAALIGAIVGVPSLRIKGLYLAITTLAAQLIIEWTINHVPFISGGTQVSIPVPKPALLGFRFETQRSCISCCCFRPAWRPLPRSTWCAVVWAVPSSPGDAGVALPMHLIEPIRDACHHALLEALR